MIEEGGIACAGTVPALDSVRKPYYSPLYLLVQLPESLAIVIYKNSVRQRLTMWKPSMSANSTSI